MKLRTKSIITLIAMLLGGIGQVAAQDTHEITPPVKSIIYLLDGKSSESAPGSITTETTVSSNGTFTVTLTVTPDLGKTYIEKDNIVVTKTISGEKAQTREFEIDNDPVELYRVADSETDPTGVTKYYFTFGNVANTRGYWKEGENVYEYEYDYEVTADFQSLIDITNATITLGETTFAYTGQEIKPTVSSVVLNGETIPADNYTVSYLYNIEPAEATAEGDVPTVQISGKLPYIGEITQKFTITKAEATLKYSKETAEATLQAEFEAPTLTVTPEGLEGITYSSSNTNAATIAEDGKVTIVGAGETTITAAFAGDEHYKEAEASYVLTVNKIATELKYSKETAEATLGAEFEAPTLTVSPEGLQGITYSSSNTNAATIAEDGKVTIVGAGETIIKATFAGNDTYEAAEASYTLTVSKIATELKFSTETATATMNAEFEAPTLTKTPEDLQGMEFTSSNEAAATVDKTTGAVTLVGAGETTIKAAFAGSTVYEAAEASYVLTVSKAKTELKFSAATAQATMNAEFQAPTLTKSPENLEGVEFTSSNEAAATVDKTTGAVTLVGAGETTIKAAFAGSTVYEASEASYTLTVNRAAGEGYLLWVNDTQVTSDNAEDVLGHTKDSSKPYYIYNKDKKQLYMDNDQTRTTVIESRMPELTVYIKDANKIKRIFFNNTGDASNKGNLTFTTNGNFPGKLIIANPTKGQSAIKGFSNISYNWDLTAIEPDGSYYDTTTLEMKYKKETEAIVIADTITIGEAIVPITEKRAITFEESQLVEKDEDGKVKKDESGNPIKANLSNYSYAPSSTTGEPEKNVIHISLNSANISDDAGGFDIENGVGGIYIEDTMTDEKAGQVAQDVNDNKIVPGGTLYAESYDGFTFKLIAGSGTIEIDEIVENDHEFHLIIGINKPITLNYNNSIIWPYDGKSVRVQAEIAFNVGAPTYCFLYMVKKTAGTRGTRLGKRDKAHGKLVSVQVRSTTVIPTEPPSEATGGVIPKSDDPEPETDPTPPTGIREVKSDKMAVKSGWYTIDGQKIAEPTQRGLYIKDGRKVVIK